MRITCAACGKLRAEKAVSRQEKNRKPCVMQEESEGCEWSEVKAEQCTCEHSHEHSFYGTRFSILQLHMEH